MLAVDDPDAATAATRTFSGTAYLIFEEVEYDDMPWITALTSKYCIKVDSTKWLRTHPSYPTSYLSSDSGISECNEAAPTEYL